MAKPSDFTLLYGFVANITHRCAVSAVATVSFLPSPNATVATACIAATAFVGTLAWAVDGTVATAGDGVVV